MLSRVGPRSYEAAVRESKDASPDVRAAALADLPRHFRAEREGVLETLGGALKDEAGIVRSAAALALADCAAPEWIDALIEAVDDDDDGVRAAALTALGEIGDAKAGEAVIGALDDDAPEVRFQAVMACARVGLPAEKAVRHLLGASRDDDTIVAHIAMRMAEELAGDGPIDRRVLKRAKALLDDDHPRLQVVAAVVLGNAGDASGADVLCAVAARELLTPEADDEAGAIELCGSLGLDAAVPHLERRAFQAVYLIRPDPFAWQARVALARMEHPKALKWIQKELGAWTRERRSLAVAAAGRAGAHGVRPLIEAMRGKPARADQDAVEEALDALDRDR